MVTFKSLSCAGLLAAAVSTCLAQSSAAGMPDSFVVQSETPRRSDVLRFRCRYGDAGKITCDMSEISVSYYLWEGTPSIDREMRRCHIVSSNWTARVFEPTGLGRWRRQEAGFCGAVIETELVTEAGQVSMRDKTIANPRPNDPICGHHGPAGTVKAYMPVLGSRPTPRACSSVVVDPW